MVVSNQNNVLLIISHTLSQLLTKAWCEFASSGDFKTKMKRQKKPRHNDGASFFSIFT